MEAVGGKERDIKSWRRDKRGEKEDIVIKSADIELKDR